MSDRRMRALLGNISLVLFLAFLFMVNPYTLFGARAHAQEGVTVEYPSKISVGPSGRIELPLTIKPTTSGYNTVRVLLEFRDESNQKVAQGVYTTPGTVYLDAYAGTLVNIVYSAPGVFPDGTTLLVVYGPYSVDQAVYLTVYLTKEKVQPGGGGGTGGGGGPTTSVGTDTGWVSVNPATGTHTGYVDPDLAYQTLSKAGTGGTALLLDVSKAVEVTGIKPVSVIGNVPSSVLQQAQSIGISLLKLDTAMVEITASPSALYTNEVKNAGTLATLRVKVEQDTEEDTQAKLSQLPAETVQNLTAASNFYRVGFSALSLTGNEQAITRLGEKATFAFSYDPSKVQNPKHLNVYEKGSLVYVGGKVDEASKKVLASLSQFKTGEFIVMEHTKTFADVPADYWGKEDIELMASKYVVLGMTDTTFEPEAMVTRAQFVTMLVRALGLGEEKPAVPTFTDVSKDAWYYGFVEAGFKAGLVHGDMGATGPFRPEDRITREEMAALIVRAMDFLGKPAPTVNEVEAEEVLARFTDKDAVSAWARQEMARAILTNIIRGRGAGEIAPVSNGKRAEAATVMSRMMSQVGII